MRFAKLQQQQHTRAMAFAHPHAWANICKHNCTSNSCLRVMWFWSEFDLHSSATAVRRASHVYPARNAKHRSISICYDYSISNYILWTCVASSRIFYLIIKKQHPFPQKEHLLLPEAQTTTVPPSSRTNLHSEMWPHTTTVRWFFDFTPSMAPKKLAPSHHQTYLVMFPAGLSAGFLVAEAPTFSWSKFIFASLSDLLLIATSRSRICSNGIMVA